MIFFAKLDLNRIPGIGVLMSDRFEGDLSNTFSKFLLVSHPAVHSSFQEHESGLYVCMNKFLGFGKDFVLEYFHRTGNAVFLHMRRIKKKVNFITIHVQKVITIKEMWS